MNFKNQTVLITGGGRGIGKTIALKFAQFGADIVLLDANNDFDEIIKSTKLLKSKCLTFQADVTDFESVENLIKKINEEQEGISILVNKF